MTGYLEEQIVKFIGTTFPSLKVTSIYNNLYGSTNNIYSLWLTKNYIKNTDILLFDSDILCDQRIIRLLLDSESANYLAICSYHHIGEEEMKVITKKDNLITNISKKLDPGFAGGESIGIEKFDSEFMEVLFEKLDYRVITERRNNDFYEAAFQDAKENWSQVSLIIQMGELLVCPG